MILTLIVFTLLYGVLAVVWFRLMHRYAIQGVRGPSTTPARTPRHDPDSARRPLSFAY